MTRTPLQVLPRTPQLVEGHPRTSSGLRGKRLPWIDLAPERALWLSGWIASLLLASRAAAGLESAAPPLPVQLTGTYQALGVEGSEARFFQYDTWPRGFFFGRLLVLGADREIPLYLHVDRPGEATASGRFEYGQTAAGKTLRGSFGTRQFYPDARLPAAQRRDVRVWLRKPEKDTTGLRLGWRQQAVSGIRPGTALDTQATDVSLSTVWFRPRVEWTVALSQRNRREAGDRQDDARSRRAYVAFQPRRPGDTAWSAFLSQWHTTGSSHGLEAQPVEQRVRATAGGFRLQRPLRSEGLFDVQYTLHVVDRDVTAPLGLSRQPIHAKSASRLVARLSYAGLPRTSLRTGLQYDLVERVAADGRVQEPSFTTLWVEGRSRPTPKGWHGGPPLQFDASYRVRTLHGAPASSLTDPRPLSARRSTHAQARLSGPLGRNTTGEASWQRETEDHPARAVDWDRTRRGVYVSSLLSPQFTLTGGYFREDWDSVQAAVSDFLSDVAAWTASAAWTVDPRTWIHVGYASWRTSGQTSVRDGQFTLAMQHRRRDEWEFAVHVRLESYEDFVRVVPNSYAANVVQLEATARF